MSSKPVVIKNFVTPEDCSSFINHIESNHTTYYNEWQGDRVFTKRYGIDAHYEDSTTDLSSLDDIRPMLSKYISKTLQACHENYSDENDLYLNVLWLVKKNPSPLEPGQNVHGDWDGGMNSHFKYSALIYFNDMDNNGQIFFPNIDFEHCPSAGDLVIFESGKPEFHHGVKPILQKRYSMPMWITELPQMNLAI